MAYVVAAYGVVVGALTLYGLHLARDRRNLQKALREAAESNGG